MDQQVLTEKIRLLDFVPDDDWQHVLVADPTTCQACRNKSCLTVCPTAVFQQGEQDSPILVYYRRCIECGACRLACPGNNIEFTYPYGGHGVAFRSG